MNIFWNHRVLKRYLYCVISYFCTLTCFLLTKLFKVLLNSCILRNKINNIIVMQRNLLVFFIYVSF